ncbi:hypothetical protein H3Z83_08495 [Tenacibaculum sp. S7007]|uniref:Cthe-2314-like HEPN domain-containing protein n=1 Tax=Tenacibaculum pelagium TaxID=2759527 RepID=A0A839AQN8_9FLAO|nr:hypothetical protein [Tenacibaculum pelagium]MBA6156549.1 hypothetical protein [Tenacibaculum pelagium]
MFKKINLNKEKKSINKQIPESLIYDYAILKGLQARKSTKYIALAELSIHLKIVQSDLSILTFNHRNCETEMEKKFYSRMISIIIYEYLNDINNLLGNKLVKELTKNNFNELINEAKTLNKVFSDFQKSHKNLFKHIRNTTGAHKSKNTEFLLRSVFDIEDEKIMNLATDIMIINNKLTRLLTTIYKRVSKFHKENGIIK